MVTPLKPGRAAHEKSRRGCTRCIRAARPRSARGWAPRISSCFAPRRRCTAAASFQLSSRLATTLLHEGVRGRFSAGAAPKRQRRSEHDCSKPDEAAGRHRTDLIRRRRGAGESFPWNGACSGFVDEYAPAVVGGVDRGVHGLLRPKYRVTVSDIVTGAFQATLRITNTSRQPVTAWRSGGDDGKSRKAGPHREVYTNGRLPQRGDARPARRRPSVSNG